MKRRRFIKALIPVVLAPVPVVKMLGKERPERPWHPIGHSHKPWVYRAGAYDGPRWEEMPPLYPVKYKDHLWAVDKP